MNAKFGVCPIVTSRSIVFVTVALIYWLIPCYIVLFWPESQCSTDPISAFLIHCLINLSRSFRFNGKNYHDSRRYFKNSWNSFFFNFNILNIYTYIYIYIWFTALSIIFSELIILLISYSWQRISHCTSFAKSESIKLFSRLWVLWVSFDSMARDSLKVIQHCHFCIYTLCSIWYFKMR